jgi:hypothetical protein
MNAFHIQTGTINLPSQARDKQTGKNVPLQETVSAPCCGLFPPHADPSTLRQSARNGSTIFLSALPMFVPSLSWQIDRF